MGHGKLKPYREDYNYNEEAYLRAEKKLKALKGFYWHAFWYTAVNIFLLVVIAQNTDDFWNFANFTTPFFWGIGLGFHALHVFGKNLVFNKNWEERKINEFMEKDKQQWE